MKWVGELGFTSCIFAPNGLIRTARDHGNEVNEVDLSLNLPKAKALGRSMDITIYASFLAVVVSLKSVATGNHDEGNRDRSHILEMLGQNDLNKNYVEQVNRTLSDLYRIYEKSIKPMEEAYRFRDLGDHVIAESDILSKPLVLFVGPWSTGKSTMINYLIGINDTENLLYTGAEPTTSEFTVVSYGEKAKTVEGLVLATDKTRGLSPLERFGQGFLERLEGKELPYEILKRVTFVDTPGIIENRKQQERGYPFNAVMRWFILRADLIFVVFDPSKLDVGSELETLFEQLKGRESQIRLILNKADQVSFQELMRVYGALFWSLAPLINVTEPPRVYVGSFWNKPFKTDQNYKLFMDEETSLLTDLSQVVENQVENKIGFIRQHATHVKIHSLLVDRYLRTFDKENSLFGDSAAIARDIIQNPDNYRIFQSVLSEAKVSKYDLPSPERYMDFFSLNSLTHFKKLDEYCRWLDGCDYDHLEEAISLAIPKLLVSFRQNLQKCLNGECH